MLAGRTGQDCDVWTSCENLDFCDGHGICLLGPACICDIGWGGPTCSMKLCQNNCKRPQRRMQCRMLLCRCGEKWSGESCATLVALAAATVWAEAHAFLELLLPPTVRRTWLWRDADLRINHCSGRDGGIRPRISCANATQVTVALIVLFPNVSTIASGCGAQILSGSRALRQWLVWHRLLTTSV